MEVRAKRQRDRGLVLDDETEIGINMITDQIIAS